MPIKKEDADAWIAEFSESTLHSLLKDSLKEHAEKILSLYLEKAEELDEENTRGVLLEEMPELELPEEPRRDVPDVLQAFVEWMEDAGRLAGGRSLGIYVQSLAKDYRNRCKPGGGLRVPPVVKKTEDIGRNDPCPCGSGKKYKKCCGA